MSTRYHNVWHYIPDAPEVVDRTVASRFSGGLSGSMFEASARRLRFGAEVMARPMVVDLMFVRSGNRSRSRAILPRSGESSLIR